ncbi:organic anion transporter 3 isoform X1 [Octopus bimaculoides]|uniref:Major facilitator superfamily (MFS) profile domain-containing protein n=1 Tax=Octopus bimaculoides TaxID=37653 RepID=A0A0L8IGH7_OCTBM|nr:organic anion transporter 3 isoform X1 [Octopus bimaculoides]|eukprot:XP_014770414.1 PREDICTED: solute carrier family 22 member 8-like [Octopus bimaculoides]
MKSSEVDVDGIIRALGESTFFHTTQCTLICAAQLLATTNSFFYIFFAITPEYKCNNLTDSQFNQYNISTNEVSLTYDKCSIHINNDEGTTTENQTLNCLNGYSYTTPADTSIVSEWDLVCNKSGLAESTQTVFILGQVISGLMSPYLIERFGRKPLRVSSNLMLIIFNLVAAFSPFYWTFAVMRFFTGVLRETYVISSITLVCELYPKEKRIIMSGLFMFIWNIYSTITGFIAYMLKDYGWNTYFLLNAVLSGYFIIDFFFLEESVRWLFANSKIKAAEKIIKKAARQNKVDFDEIWCTFVKDTALQETGQVNETSLQSRSSEPSPPVTAVVDHTQPLSEEESSVFVKLLTIFKSPYLRKVTIVVSIEWAVNTTAQNIILLMMEVFGGSIYINYSILYFLAIISVGLAAALAKRFGHKFSLTCLKTGVAICIISASLIKIWAEDSELMEYVFLALYLVSAAGLNAASCNDYIYTSELYPTQIRSAGNGFATTFMRCVCMITPYFKLLALAIPWAPGIIIGVACLCSTVMLRVCLPETGNRVLPQTIEEVNKMEQENKKNSVKIQ